MWRNAEVATGKEARKIRSEARRQSVISLITAFEVYLGDIVVELMDKYGINLHEDENLKKLFNRSKFSIFELHQILKDKITIGELVCWEINFQNMTLAFSFLSSLFGTDFSKLISNNKFAYKNTKGMDVTISLKSTFPARLDKLLKLRHLYIHDVDFRSTPSKPDIIRYRRLIRELITCIDVKVDSYRNVTSSVIIPK